jgi:hypothetical protein
VCVPFAGEQVDALAWAPDGATLAVASDLLADGTTVIRRLAWPSLGVEDVARGADISKDSVGAGEAGEVVWVRQGATDAWIESARPGDAAARRLARLQSAPVVNLLRMQQGVAVLNEPRPGTSRITLYRDDGSIDALYETAEIIDSFGASFDGGTLAVHHYPEVGEVGAVTVMIGADEMIYDPPEGGMRRLTVSGDRNQLVFVSNATAQLTATDLTLEGPTPLAEAVVSGELSLNRAVAWVPAPTDTVEVPVCLRAP